MKFCGKTGYRDKGRLSASSDQEVRGRTRTAPAGAGLGEGHLLPGNIPANVANALVGKENDLWLHDEEQTTEGQE